jgi:hypothetical protein
MQASYAIKVCLLFVLIPSESRLCGAQLEAPGALSTYSGCAHHTCTWVPSGAHKSFSRGDLTYTVKVRDEDDGGTFILRKGKRELLHAELKDLSASVSAVWADDEKRFAVTWSDGGAIGGFHVRVFRIEEDRVAELPAIDKAFAAFKSRYWCKARGDNVQAYDWLEDSRRLVLVLSVYPTGDCGKDSGHTDAYVVDAETGDVQERWGMRRLNAYIRSHPE